LSALSRAELLAHMRAERHAVVASVSGAGAPQSALMGIVVSDDFEIFFDTVDTTRKAANLRARPRASVVIGSVSPDAQVSVQIDGVADEPRGADRERLTALYYARFPDGPSRLAWPGIMYMRVRPTWVRLSDYRPQPPRILELDAAALAALK
jgi:general stress protein 26